MTVAAKVSLNNGVQLDQLGLGLYKVPVPDTAGLCTLALETGYRHFDTAAFYGNEAGVGEAVRAAVDVGEVTRTDVFVTTKIWNTDQGADRTLRAFGLAQAQLGLDYIDLLLIHWPCPARGLFIETYRAMEQLYHEGQVRAIGVSNFQPAQLKQLLAETEVVPAVNQIELHPWLQQAELRDLHRRHGILTSAWSPLGRGAVLADPVIREIAAQVGCSPAQVILRWHLQLGNIVIPKASSQQRLAENFAAQDIVLSDAQMDAITALNRNQRTGSSPDEVN